MKEKFDVTGMTCSAWQPSERTAAKRTIRSLFFIPVSSHPPDVCIL